MQVQNSQRGFSLIEVLVALGLFMIVMTMGVGAFTSILEANRKAQALQTSVNNAYFSFETMTRLIRTGTVYDCNSLDGTPSPNNCNGGTSIQFYDDTGRVLQFRSNNNVIEESIDGGTWFPLTAPDFSLKNFSLHVTGTAQYLGTNDTTQPTVTIVIVGKVHEGKPTETEIKMETTVTQRTIDL